MSTGATGTGRWWQPVLEAHGQPGPPGGEGMAWGAGFGPGSPVPTGLLSWERCHSHPQKLQDP